MLGKKILCHIGLVVALNLFSSCTDGVGAGHGSELDGAGSENVNGADLAADRETASDAFGEASDEAAAPETRIDSGPQGLVNTPEAVFAFSSPAAGVDFECRVSSGSFEPCTSPFALVGLSDGDYLFAVRAGRNSGDWDPTPAERSWTVDTKPPETTILSGPPSSSNDPVALFAFASEPGARFRCRLDGTALVDCTSPFTRVVEKGPHTFEVLAIDSAGNADPTPAGWHFSIVIDHPTRIRLVAANLTSGNNQSYDPGDGARILKGLAPDVVMLQEFNFGDNSESALRAFVDSNFGPAFWFVRESGKSIPNGIISRFTILEWGVWDDPEVSDREFVWARIDVPGDKDLWAVSLHLKASDASRRSTQATALVAYIKAKVPLSDFLVLAGDLNTKSRTETCMQKLSAVVVTASPYPVDQRVNGNTSAQRDDPYDWVLVDEDLGARLVPVVLGTSTYPNGLVFDSQIYTPLSDAPGVLFSDSRATNMQHMAVIRDVAFP